MIERWTSLTQRRWAFWLAVAAVLALSLSPRAELLPSTGWDKSNHALAFAVLTILGRMSYSARRMRVLLGLLAYGVLIEVLQSFTGYRSGEWLDVFADSLGIAIGWQFTVLMRRFEKQKATSGAGSGGG
jgi:VanZ family protein